MSRVTALTLLATGIAIFIFLLLAAADLGSGNACAPQFPKWFGCVLDAHDGFAGGLVGAGGALFAGWLAWTGVRDQVQAERELSIAREQGSLKAILAEMNDLFDSLNEIWRVIDLACLAAQPAELRASRIAVASAILPILPARGPLDELKDFTDALAREINPTKRGQFIRVWQSIEWIYRARQEENRNAPAGDDGTFRLKIIRIHLSHLERYLRVFDLETSKKFESRWKEDVDHRGIAAQIKPMVDRAERGEGL